MILSSDALLVLLGALAFDALIGDPDMLWRRVPHPVAWIGQGIAALDRALNREAWPGQSRRAAGAVSLLVLVVLSAAAGWLVETSLRLLPGGSVLVALIASVFLAQRSLYEHVAAVAGAFAHGLPEARVAVCRIVGRDPESLDEAGVCRAAIESCAENFSDGVVAPAFWFALLGLPGLLAYKAVNTADSMVGHRSPRHEAFGWASARFDDLVNLLPARLSGLLIATTAGPRFGEVVGRMLRDAPRHRSPNAGWPESAIAATLGLALAGPRRYGGEVVDDPFLNEQGRRDADADDIRRALRVLLTAAALHAGIYAILALLLP